MKEGRKEEKLYNCKHINLNLKMKLFFREKDFVALYSFPLFIDVPLSDIHRNIISPQTVNCTNCNSSLQPTAAIRKMEGFLPYLTRSITALTNMI